PLAQARAGRDVLEPQVQRQRLLADAARPQPLDQDPRAVGAGRWLIGALEPDVHGPTLGPWTAPINPRPPRSVALFAQRQIGRASCRERVEVWVGAVQ